MINLWLIYRDYGDTGGVQWGTPVVSMPVSIFWVMVIYDNWMRAGGTSILGNLHSIVPRNDMSC